MLSLVGKVDFRETAVKNEDILRAILEDLKANRYERTMGGCVPEDLDTTSPIETIYQKYSLVDDVFTILSFTVPDDKKTAIIHFQGPLFAGCGDAKLQYTIDENKKVSFDHKVACWMY